MVDIKNSKMKTFYVATFAFIYLVLMTANYLPSSAGNPVKVVVIDAGHGGHDPGAIGVTGIREKDITLKIALKLGALIEKNTDVKVVYTRKTDVFVELYRRAQIANINHADLFISIHCNSAENNNVEGSESFIMGLDKSKNNLAIAEKENAAILSESNHENNYNGFDPSSSEAYIIFSLYQNAYLNQSIKMAAAIQSEFKTTYNRVDRGVKQAPFLVLWRTAMPSILIESGFISNRNEEDYLASDKGQTELATAIFKAFMKLNQVAVTEPVPAAPDTLPPVEMGYKVQFMTYDSKLKLTDPKLKNLQDITIEPSGSKYRYTTGKCQTWDEAKTLLDRVQKLGFKDAFTINCPKENEIAASVPENTKPITTKPAKEATPVVTDTQTTAAAPLNDNDTMKRVLIVYKIQFLYSVKHIEKTDPELKNLPDIEIEPTGNGYKYTSGNCSTHAEARELLTRVKKAGFSDAFIVALDSDKSKTTPQESTKNNTESVSVNENGLSNVIYKVQFMTLPDELKTTDPTLKRLPDCTIVKSGHQYIYMSGKCAARSEADKLLRRVKDAGFSDAFIVAYTKEGKRITLQQAKELENKK